MQPKRPLFSSILVAALTGALAMVAASLLLPLGRVSSPGVWAAAIGFALIAGVLYHRRSK